MAGTKEQLDDFMTRSGYTLPDIDDINARYEGLERHLHESFSWSAGDASQKSRPQVVVYKFGTFALGLPGTVPFLLATAS
jgi:hypothetical protein